MMPALAMIGAMLTPSSLSDHGAERSRQITPVMMLLSRSPIVSARCTRRVGGARGRARLWRALPRAPNRLDPVGQHAVLGAARRAGRSAGAGPSGRRGRAGPAARMRQRLADQPVGGVGEPSALSVQLDRPARRLRRRLVAASVSSRPNMGAMSTAPVTAVEPSRAGTLARVTHRPRSDLAAVRRAVTAVRRSCRGARRCSPRRPRRRGRPGGLERPRRRSTRCTPLLLLVGVPLLLFLVITLLVDAARRWSRASGSRPGGQAHRDRVVRRPAQGVEPPTSCAAAGRPTTPKAGWRKWPLVSFTAAERHADRQGDPRGRAASRASSSRVFVGRAEGEPRAVRRAAAQLAGRPGAQHPDPGRPGRPGARDRHRRATCAAASPTSEVELAALHDADARSPTGDLVGGLRRGIQHARRARPRARRPCTPDRAARPRRAKRPTRRRVRHLSAIPAVAAQASASLAWAARARATSARPSLHVALGGRVGRSSFQPGVDPVEQSPGWRAASGTCTPAGRGALGALLLPDRVGRGEVLLDVRREHLVLAGLLEGEHDAALRLVGDVVAHHRDRPTPRPWPRRSASRARARGGVLLAGDGVVAVELGVDPVVVGAAVARPAP